MLQLRDALDLAASFRASGRTWVELDDAGQVVERGATKATKAVTGARKPAAKRARRAG